MTEQTKKEETRKRILEAALGLFQSKGYEATTMRDIAEQAGMAVGAAYYHFRSKEEIVFAYYVATQEDAEAHAANLIKTEKDAKKRVEEIIRFKLNQLSPYRPFLSVLGQIAVSPNNPLSPFSSESKELRLRAIKIFEVALEKSNLKVAKQLSPYLAKIMWFYEMGIIFFWLHDESPQQRRTFNLLDETVGLVIRVLGMSALPLLKPLNTKIAKIISIIEERAA